MGTDCRDMGQGSPVWASDLEGEGCEKGVQELTQLCAGREKGRMGARSGLGPRGAWGGRAGRWSPEERRRGQQGARGGGEPEGLTVLGWGGHTCSPAPSLPSPCHRVLCVPHSWCTPATSSSPTRRWVPALSGADLTWGAGPHWLSCVSEKQHLLPVLSRLPLR